MKNSIRTLLCIASTALMGNILAQEPQGLPNISPRPKTQPRTIDIAADLLYWYTSETIDWAFTLQQNPTYFESSFKTAVFDWAPGFRVGLGYNMLHDQWDTQASFTWFQSKASGQTSGSVTPAFFAARLSLLEPFSTGTAVINLHYNMFDWDLGRSFLISKYLLLRPSIGLKSGWIDQTIHSHWTKPNVFDFFLFTAEENLKQRFLGGGPKGGASAKWCFGNIRNHSFSLVSKLEAGYLWGHWSIRDHFIDDLGTKISVNTSTRNFASTMLHCFLGIGWDCNFDHDRSHFGLKLGYEIEDWFNYCQIFTDSSGSQNNDLILQGFDLGLNFDF